MRRLLTPRNLLLLVLLAVMFWSFYSGASPSHGTPPASADKAATGQVRRKPRMAHPSSRWACRWPICRS